MIITELPEVDHKRLIDILTYFLESYRELSEMGPYLQLSILQKTGVRRSLRYITNISINRDYDNKYSIRIQVSQNVNIKYPVLDFTIPEKEMEATLSLLLLR